MTKLNQKKLKNNFFNLLKFNYKIYLLSIGILFLPLYEIIISNFFVFKFNHYINSLICFLLILTIIYFTSLLIRNIFFFNHYAYLKVSLFVMLNFYFQDTTIKLEKYFNTYHNYITLILIFIFYLCILFIFAKKEKFFIKFLSIFLFINFLFLTYQLINITYFSQINLADKKIYPLKELNYIKKKDDKNIYYVIVDEMISLENFEKKYNYNLKKYKDNFLKLGGVYFDNSNSVYDNTTLTTSSVFNLDYIAKENDIFNYNSDTSFPNFLKKNNFEKQNTNLTKFLKKLDYKFIWIDNSSTECSNYNNNLCLENSIKNNFLINQASKLILSRTFLHSIIFKYEASKETTFIRNNGIKRLMDYLNKNNPESFEKKNFFFVHNFSTHSPYLYDKDCKFKKNQILKKINPEKDYEHAYICTLNQIVEFIKYIKKNDNNSIIVVNADHGLRINKGLDHSIFNLIYPKKCSNNKKKSTNQLDTIFILVSCVSNLDLQFKKNEQYKSSIYKYNGNLLIKKK